jgi:hypothetical protein
LGNKKREKEMKHALWFVISLLLLSSPSYAQSIFEKVPDEPDKSAKYITYIHGSGIDTGGQWETDNFHWVVKALADRGFTVIGEKRVQGMISRIPEDLEAYAEKMTKSIQKLIDAGIPPANITVVGYSRGGVIAIITSGILARSDISYVLNAGCLSDTGRAKKYAPLFVEKYASKMKGRFLSLTDSEDPDASSCSRYFDKAAQPLEHNEIVLNTGNRHETFGKPADAWVKPLVDFAKIK